MQGKSKRLPAFEVDDLELVKTYLLKNNIRIKDAQPIPDFNRFSLFDYWDNRIEFMEKK